MRRRRWVLLLLCLSASPLLFSEITDASATLRVDEAATRFIFEPGRTGAALGVLNPTGREVVALVRVELLDPQGSVRAEAALRETIGRGTTTLFVPVAFRPSDLDPGVLRQLLWYRLRYTLTPQTPADDGAQTSGVVSLSAITPGLFELRVSASNYAREGSRYRARARATHPLSGDPVEGVAVEAQIEMDDDEGHAVVLKASGLTDREGYVTLDFELPPKISADSAELKVTGRRGDLVQEAQDSIRFDNMTRFLVSTDKPLYQPGQTLHARVLLLSPSRQALPGAATPFKITDPEDTVVFRSRIVTSRFGVASADWPIPENARLGDYTVTFGDDDSSSGTHKVKISRYDLPNFTAEVKPDRPFYLPGQNAEVLVRASYLFGQPVRRGRVRVVRETERSWNYREQKWETEEGDEYEGLADAQGRARFRINLKEEHEELKGSGWSQFRDVTYAAYFTDASTGRTEQRRFDLRVTREPIHVYFIGDTYDHSSRLPLEFYVSTFYADGTPAPCEVAVSEILKKGDDEEEETRRLALVRTNRYGVAKVSALRPVGEEGGGRADLRLSARDARGARGHKEKTFYSDDKPAIRVTTDKTFYRAGEPVNVRVVSSEKNLGRAVVDVSRNWQVLRSEVVSLRDGLGSISVPADDRFRDEITVTASADLSPRDPASDSHTVLYPRRRDLQLDVSPSSDKYRPGEEAHINFRVRSPAGSSAEGALGVVVFDRAVEERARTDSEFGSGYNLYGNYNQLLGWDDSLAGVKRSDLDRVDLSKPPPADLSLLAEVMLNGSDNYYPNAFGGEAYETNQVTVFAPSINAQLAPALAALNALYAARAEYPADEDSLRRVLAEAGIQFDSLRDPWGTPYNALFFVEKENDVLKLMSACADKQFGTEDDFSVAVVSRPYFRKVGEAIDRAVLKYHERTGGYVRDAATLGAALLGEGVDLNTLRDRWGEPYALDFGVNRTNYVLSVRSGGPDRVLDRLSKAPWNDFFLWFSTIDYFSETRERVDAALDSYAKETRSFPADVKGLRAALARSGLDYDGLRDPWGRAYYATFKTESRYSDRVVTSAGPGPGRQTEPRTEIQPVTQTVGFVTIRSAGADGREGTADDFDAGVFSQIVKEQARRATKQKHGAFVLTGEGGAVSGTVVDTQGGVVPGVAVRATLSSTSLFYEARTDDEGRYLLRNLPPGTYELSAEGVGFAPSIVRDVRVEARNVTEVNITLWPGAATETVTVTGDSGAKIDTTSNSVASSVRVQNAELATVRRSGASSTPRLREYFPETLVWQPSLETDAEGRAQLSFKLADNITTWKMAVIGSTADGEIGFAESEILAFQPFFVEHDPPRVLTEGDEIQLPVVLRNYLNSAQTVDLTIKPEDWFAMLGPAEKRAQVAAGDDARATFGFRAVAAAADGHQRVTAVGADASDQIERPVSVHPDGEELAQTVSGILSDSAAALETQIPADAIKGSVRSELKIYPSLLAHVIESIEAIMERPHGCAEQTISSAYPSLLALRAYKRAGRDAPAAAKARRYVQVGYERLLNYSAADGGFSYWGRGGADVALTAYALRFLSDAREFIEVDEDVLKLTSEWLVSQQRPDGRWSVSAPWDKAEDTRRSALLTAHVARVLAATTNDAAASAPLKRALAYLSEKARAIDEPYLIAAYALASLDAGDADAAGQAVARLRTLAREEDGTSYWALETNTPFYGWGLAGRIETTALALQALSRYCGLRTADCGLEDRRSASSNLQSTIGNPQLIDRGLLFLLRQQDRYGVWYSTQATVNTLDALVTLLGQRANAAGGRAEIFVNGKPAATLELPPGGEVSGPLTADISGAVAPGGNRIEVRRAAGSAPASVQVVSTYYVPWRRARAASHAESARELRLSVSYDRSAARVGDEVTCRVAAERVGFRGYGMLLAEIGLPPGADVDRSTLESAMKGSEWGLSQYDVLPDRVVVYLWPRAGGTNFVFKFRPRFGLNALTAPSLLYDYYNPEARVVVAPTKFVVK